MIPSCPWCGNDDPDWIQDNDRDEPAEKLYVCVRLCPPEDVSPGGDLAYGYSDDTYCGEIFGPALKEE